MKLTLFFLLLLPLLASAQTPLSWQKVELEDKVLIKVKASLGNVLEQNQFLVEVEAKVNDPGMPNFDDIVKKGSKVSDVKFDDSKGDYIAFSKVGLEVPVVEEFHKENQQKLKEMYRYSESFDIFKNLDEVKINVYLSDLLKPEQVEIAKNVVNSLKFPLGDLKPKVNISSIKLEEKKVPLPVVAPKKVEPKKKVEDPLTLKDILNFISRFGNAIGLILATIILGISAWILMKKYFQLKKDHEAKPEIEEVEEDLPPPLEEVMIAETEELPSFALTSKENFERLRNFLQSQPLESMVMIKNWINSSTEDTELALKGLAQQLSDEELISLFSGLNDQERDKWRSSLDSFLNEEQLFDSNRFMSEEVVRTMVDPGKVKDIELIDLVLSLPLDVSCRFVVEKVEQGKILMNLLTPPQITKILNRLSEQDGDLALANSLDCDFMAIKDGFAKFKGELKDYVNLQKQRPFNSKIIQMVGDFNPLKESMLYSLLAKSGMQDEMFKTARANLPYDCVTRLPRELIKDFMQAYPITKKVQFLSVCGDEMKADLLKAFAEQGSTARQMLDLEFDNLTSDKATLARLQIQKDLVVKEFVIYVRSYLMSHKETEQDVEFAVRDWVQSFNSTKPELKIVA